MHCCRRYRVDMQLLLQHHVAAVYWVVIEAPCSWSTGIHCCGRYRVDMQLLLEHRVAGVYWLLLGLHEVSPV